MHREVQLGVSHLVGGGDQAGSLIENRRDELQEIQPALMGGLTEKMLQEPALLRALNELVERDEHAGERSLQIDIDEQRPVAAVGERGAQMGRDRRFAHAAFEIEDGDDGRLALGQRAKPRRPGMDALLPKSSLKLQHLLDQPRGPLFVGLHVRRAILGRLQLGGELRFLVPGTLLRQFQFSADFARLALSFGLHVLEILVAFLSLAKVVFELPYLILQFVLVFLGPIPGDAHAGDRTNRGDDGARDNEKTGMLLEITEDVAHGRNPGCNRARITSSGQRPYGARRWKATEFTSTTAQINSDLNKYVREAPRNEGGAEAAHPGSLGPDQGPGQRPVER